MKDQRRYPGARPFNRDQAGLFFGRENDIRNLHHLVSLEPIVVVYGKSGYGKSSLINAGLLPILEKDQRNLCLMPRLNAWKDQNSEPPLQKTRIILKSIPKDYTILDKVLPDDDTLWRKIKAAQMAQPDHRLLFFFDQFEELFTYPKDQINSFKTQIAELVRNQLPRRYEKALDAAGSLDDELLSLEEEKQLYAPLNIRLVFIIRSDKMHLLDQLSDYLPRILKNNYEIKALKESDAMSALVSPAMLTGEKYISPTFTFDKGAREKIMKFLKDENSGLVEAIQLQILATSFEDKVIDDGVRELTADNIGNLQAIIENYYHNKLASITNKEERALAAKMIEEGLVDRSREQRLTLHESQIKDLFSVETTLLNQLVNAHLLRRQPDSRSGYNYELSHDTLIAPVLAAREIREKEEKQRAFEKQQKELEKERRRRAKITRIAWIAGSLAVLAAIALYVAITQYQEAQKAILSYEEANIAREMSDRQKMMAEEARMMSEIQKMRADSARAVALVELENELKTSERLRIEADNALEDKEKALIDLTEQTNIAKALAKKGFNLKNTLGSRDAVNFLMTEGEKEWGMNNFQNALTYYANALFLYDSVSIDYAAVHNEYSYKEIEKKKEEAKKIAEIEKRFRAGDLDGFKKLYDLYDIPEKEIFLENRMNQMDYSDNAFYEAMYDWEPGEKNALEFVRYMESGDLTTWLEKNNDRLNGLNKVSISTGSTDLFLESMPPSVDSLEIISSLINRIPTINNNQIKYLKIHDCPNLKAINDEILNYSQLETLVLTDLNNLETFTLRVKELKSLRHVKVKGNHNLALLLYFLLEENLELKSLVIEELKLSPSAGAFGYPTYEDFGHDEFGHDDLAYNLLSDLPKLEILEIRNTFFKDLSSDLDFTRLPLLKSLTLENISETSTLRNLENLSHLEELKIKNLPLKNDFLEQIENMSGLKKLELHDLTELMTWKSINQLSNLQHLSLRNIPAEIDIHPDLLEMKKLHYLELDQLNMPTTFPSNINSLNKLEILKLNHLEMDDFLLDPSNLRELKLLSLLEIKGLESRRGAFDIVSQLPALKALYISTQYPEFIKAMDQLEKLRIELSPLGLPVEKRDTFPDIFSENSALRTLQIEDTYARFLPLNISNMKNLESLVLWGTRIEMLPHTLSNNSELRNIILWDCPALKTIPPTLKELENLQYVVYKNALKDFDEDEYEGINGTFFEKVSTLKELQEFMKDLNIY